MKLPLESTDIQEIIPHRYPFLLIDKVIEFEKGNQIVGTKSVSFNEPFFQGHFPGRPIMPGVLILEAMAQLGALFAKLSVDESERGGLIVFSGAESVKFRKQVLPGDTLKIVCGNCKTRMKHWKIEASAYVGETKVASATLLASQVD